MAPPKRRSLEEVLRSISQDATRVAPRGGGPKMDMSAVERAKRKNPGVDRGTPWEQLKAVLPKRVRETARRVADSTLPHRNDPDVRKNAKRLMKLASSAVDISNLDAAASSFPAAVKIGSKIFKGKDHMEASYQAQKWLGANPSRESVEDGYMIGDDFITRKEFYDKYGDARSERFTDAFRAKAYKAGERATFRSPDGHIIPPMYSHLDLVEKYPKIDFSTWEHGYVDAGGGFINNIVPKADPLDAAILKAHESGGSTFDPRTGQNMTGKNRWAVGAHPDRTMTLDRAPTAEDLRTFREKNADLLKDKDAYVGTWFDKANNKHVFDVTRLYGSKGLATKVAQEMNQDAIFNLKTFTEAPITPVTDTGERAKLRADLDQLIPQRAAARREAVLRNLTPAQVKQFEKLPKTYQAQVERVYSLMPTAREGASLALMGADQRGWYQASGETLQEMFGDDAPRFAALLAATSPQKSVEENLIESFGVWNQWLKNGRNPDKLDLGRLMPSVTPAVKRVMSLTNDELLDPVMLAEGGILNGPKVDAFYSNLVGETQRITTDTHMAKAGPTDKLGVTKVQRKLGMDAATREVANEIERLTGIKLQPREIQEMQWSPLRAMSTARGDAMPPVEKFIQTLKDTPSFATYMSDPRVAPLIAEAGIPMPTPRKPAGLQGVDPSLVRPEDVRSIQDRIRMYKRGDYLFGATPFLGAGLLQQLPSQQPEGQQQRSPFRLF